MFASFSTNDRDRDYRDRDRDTNNTRDARGRRGSSSHSTRPGRSGSNGSTFNPFALPPSSTQERFNIPPRRPSFSYSTSPFDNLDNLNYSPPQHARDPRLMRRSKSSPSPAQDYEEDGMRDSHDLSMSPRFERDSLVDNLLLSFDKLGDGSLGFDRNFFGGGGRFDEVPDDASIGSQRTTNTGYTRGRRSNSSSNYHAHLRTSMGRRYGSMDYDDESPGFGVTYGRRETHSRRGHSSAGPANGLLDYDDAAPTPTVYSGPRDRSMTITGQQTEALQPTTSAGKQASSSLSRRPSNKSLKSLKRLAHPSAEQRDFFGGNNAVPPVPAQYIGPSATAPPVMQTPTKQSKPGFFRRVFGGGSSHANNNSPSSVTTTTDKYRSQSAGEDQEVPSSRHGYGGSSHSQGGAFETSAQEPLPPPPPMPAVGQNTIKPKTSFFSRRRKKSISDQPVAPAQLLQLPLATQQALGVDGLPEPSPVSSLRAVMSPYLRSPMKSPGKEQFTSNLNDGSGTAYLTKDATIRTVTATEPGSPKARPTFFGESERRGSTTNNPFSSFGRSGTKFVRKNEAGKSPELGPMLDPTTPARKGVERPQTSPHAPPLSLLTDSKDDAESMAPPPIPPRYRKSLDNFKAEAELAPPQLAAPTFTDPKWNLEPLKERPILTMKEIEQHHAREMKRRASENLGIDTTNVDREGVTTSASNDGASGSPAKEASWLNSPTPVEAVKTPTISLQMDGEKPEPLGDHESGSEVSIEEDITEAEREKARKIYEGDEEISKDKAAGMLAEAGSVGERLRRAYMDLYDFSGMNILSSLRQLCSRLILRGETQAMDRIIDAVAKRWVECNPNHGLKTIDVVHTIIYSILLLNTDLHMAEIPNSQKMTRGQFLKNTMATIKRGLQDAATPTPLDPRPQHHAGPPRSQTPFRSEESPAPSSKTSTSNLSYQRHGSRPSIDYGRGTRNSSRASNIGTIPSPRLPPEDGDKVDYEGDGNCALVNKPMSGGLRAWEAQVEFILKDFYSSLKETALPLHGSTPISKDATPGGLSVFGNSMLRRSPSTVSKAGSEHSLTSARRNNHSQNQLSMTNKWAQKNRSRPRLYPGSHAGSSRTSLEERSIWSPTGSSTWSKLSLNHTATSTLSVDSLHSAFAGDYQQSIGFANALSHAIIREESTYSENPEEATFEDFEDMELVGPPFAKEGMLKHKHHLEAVDKKAKNRGWTEVFCVVEKGYVRMFQFSEKSGAKSQAAVGVVGGGNWSENANSVGYFTLRQTLASALPPPGYSKARPHVWALSLPTGAVHLFQGGSAETVKEWVTTANYWSARLSKEPLVGGVSNVEYGWGESILTESDTGSTFGPRPSLQESIRSSLDHGHNRDPRPRLPGDKIPLSDWTPPPLSLLTSTLSEPAQLAALTSYVTSIEAELQRHNDLRGAMMGAFSARGVNAGRAMGNWERKSSYLLHEIVKFRTYIECLKQAGEVRERVRKERGERKGSAVGVEGDFGN